MAQVKSLVREFAKHALSKRGAEQSPSWLFHDPLEEPHLRVSFVTGWNSFFELDREQEYDGQNWKEIGQSLRLPVLSDLLDRHRGRYPVIRQADWLERDGHVMLEVPVDAELPIDFLKSLVDDAHAIVWRKLD